MLVLAGAGTGKTRVITHRVVALLLEGVPPWQILAVTFTNKAAGEMRERIAALCEQDPKLQDVDSSRMWVGTFHAISARILRQHGEGVGLSPRFAIYDSADQRSLMKTVLKALNFDSKQYPPKAILGDIDRAKNRGFTWDRDSLQKIGLFEPRLDVVRKAWRAYEKRLRAADAADFGDLLTLCVRLLQSVKLEGEGGQLAGFDPVAKLRQRFSHVVVDEFQDTNPVQTALVEALSTRAELCVVGDDDQSIYGWRGADVSQILDFAESHAPCEVIRLEQNYRSTGHILACADAIIRHNEGRLGKTLWSDLGEGELVTAACLEDERDEARWVASHIAHAAMQEGASLNDFAIFYRAHAQSRALEEAFRRADLPYKMVGGTRFFDRLEIKDVIAYLRLLVNPASEMDFVRVVNKPARGIGAKTVARLQIAAAKDGQSVIDVARDPRKAGVGAGAARKVQGFVALYDELIIQMPGLAIDELADLILDLSGYRERLSAEGTDEAQSRLENLQEFLGALSEFVREQPEASLADYLEQVSLATSEDEGDVDRDSVTMMTVHSAKGLEFERVFVVGMEEGVFPHARSIDDPVQMEEERRLAYVAVTRAKRELSLTFVTRRWIFGQTQVNAPSRFVGDLPPERIEEIGVRRPSGRLHFGATGLADAPPVAEPSWDDDIVIDEVAAAAAGDGVSLYVGMPLRHAKFGVGDLVGWSGMGAQLKLSVRFPTVGQKTILARFCQPA